MSTLRISEKRRMHITFVLISLTWVTAALLVVQHLAPRPGSNTEGRRSRLAKNEQVLDLQQDIVDEQEDLYLEISTMKFDVYQKYLVYELREKIKAFAQRDPLNAAHRMRVAKLLNILMDAREDLVAKQNNTILINDSVKNCREGHNIIKQE